MGAQAFIIARNRDLEEKDLLAQSLEDQLKRVEEMDKQLGRGLTRISLGIFGKGKEKEIAEVAPEPPPAEVAVELAKIHDENIDMLEDNPDSPEAIKKQIDTLKKELEDLTKLISERYLNEDNPDCVEAPLGPPLAASESTKSLG